MRPDPYEPNRQWHDTQQPRMRSLVSAPEQEGMPAEDEPKLPLKNGATVPVRQGLGEAFSLRNLLQTHPQHIEFLLKLARGADLATDSRRRDQAYQQSLRFLRDAGKLQADSTVHPLTRDVLVSGYQRTPDGPMITQPFVIAYANDKSLGDRIQAEFETALGKLLRLDKGNNDPGPSR